MPTGETRWNASSSMHSSKSTEIAPPILAFERYIVPVVEILLLPIFFGSIGYSIPFVPLWRGRIIWRGIVYALLMALGKMACGAWLLLLPTRPDPSSRRELSTWKGSVIVGVAMIARGEIGLL